MPYVDITPADLGKGYIPLKSTGAYEDIAEDDLTDEFVPLGRVPPAPRRTPPQPEVAAEPPAAPPLSIPEQQLAELDVSKVITPPAVVDSKLPVTDPRTIGLSQEARQVGVANYNDWFRAFLPAVSASMRPTVPVKKGKTWPRVAVPPSRQQQAALDNLKSVEERLNVATPTEVAGAGALAISSLAILHGVGSELLTLGKSLPFTTNLITKLGNIIRGRPEKLIETEIEMITRLSKEGSSLAKLARENPRAFELLRERSRGAISKEFIVEPPVTGTPGALPPAPVDKFPLLTEPAVRAATPAVAAKPPAAPVLQRVAAGIAEPPGITKEIADPSRPVLTRAIQKETIVHLSFDRSSRVPTSKELKDFLSDDEIGVAVTKLGADATQAITGTARYRLDAYNAKTFAHSTQAAEKVIQKLGGKEFSTPSELEKRIPGFERMETVISAAAKLSAGVAPTKPSATPTEAPAVHKPPTPPTEPGIPSGAADIGGYAENPSIIEMPEMVALAKDLMGGKSPVIKERLRLLKGQAVGTFHPRGEGEIAIKADLFENPQQAAKTIAHEIGHLVDWLDDKTLKRGNVLGHIAALKKHLKHGLDEIPPLQKKEILAEMKAAAFAWKPIPEDADAKFIKYRNKPEELYADVFSMFINSPDTLRTIAPKTMNAILGYMHKRPSVKDNYEYMQELIKSGEPQIIENRQARVREMFDKGEEIAKQGIRRRPITWSKIQTEIVDQFTPVLEKIRQAKKMGVKIDPKDNPEYAYDDMLYTLSENRAWLRADDEILNTLKKSGLSWDDFGEYLFHQRVIVERGKLANPLGFTPETSQRQLTHLKDKIGNDNYTLLETSGVKFYENQEYVINKLREADMIGDDFLESPAYATFDVLKYYEDKFGPEISEQAYSSPSISSKIYKQIGTLSDVRNPATATLVKGLSQIWAANRKIAAKKTITFFQQTFPDAVFPADKRWNGKYMVPVPPKDPRLGMIVYPDKNADGEIRMKGYYVDKTVADSFNYNPREGGAIISALTFANNIFRGIFVGYNPGFWGFNFMRDLHRTVRNIPGASYPSIVNNYVKVLPSAIKRSIGVADELVYELERGKILPTVSGHLGVTAEDQQVERLLKKYSLSQKTWGSNIIKPFQVFFSGIEKIKEIGEIIETLPKAAAYKFLVTKYPDMAKEEVAHLVRNYAGTPNFKHTGRLTQFTNNIFLFSNIAVQGYRTDVNVAKERPGEFAYKMGQQLLPKILMLAASFGLLGKAAKDLIDDASEYDKTNYSIIPLGRTDNGKTVYLRIPLDETSRTVGGLLWKMAHLQKPKDMAAAFDYTAGQFPGLTPSISIPLDVIDYATGKNPYNSFYGSLAIPRQEFEAGGLRAAKSFGKYLYGEAGGTIVYKFKGNQVNEIQTEMESILGAPIVGNVIGRWIKISNRGQTDAIRRVLEDKRQERAGALLTVKDRIIEHINTTDRADIAGVLELYDALKEEGLSVGRRSDFVNKYTTAFKYKANQPLMNAYLGARSKEEQALIKKEMLKKGIVAPVGTRAGRLRQLMESANKRQRERK